MLDIKFIRENKELVSEGAKKKHIQFNVDDLLKVDEERRELLTSLEKKRAEQNQVSNSVVKAEGTEREKLIASMKVLKAGMEKEDEKLKDVMKKWQTLMLAVPNIPDMSVPDGNSDADNKEVKVWGVKPFDSAQGKPQFSFKPKNHVELMEALQMVDLKKGTEVAGFRGYFLKNDGAKLSFALWQLAFEFFMNKGDFMPMIVPSLVRRETLLGTGYLPQGEEDLYKTQDGDYLAGTAEVSTMSYFSDTVLNKEELPKKTLSFSPCFRREVGSYGKDTKGIMRVHEFYKLEQVVLCEASHEESVRLHEWLNRNTEEFMEFLGIPYRTVVNCGADLGLGQVKKYDIELWVPSEEKYREISSASYFHDFQTRRLNIKYKDDEGKLRFAHSLNCTALPTPRILIALVENYQQADGSIKIPEVLQKYFGKAEIK